MGREKPTAPWSVGPVRVRRVRGPREDGLIYWRATHAQDGAEKVVWAGWARRQDPQVAREIAKQADAQAQDAGPGGLPGDRMIHLFGCWKAEQTERMERGELRETSWGTYKVSLRHLAAGLGEVRIDRVRDTTLLDYRSARLGAGAAARTVEREMTVFSLAWRWGRGRGLTPDTAIKIPAVKGPYVRNRSTPTQAEILRVIECARYPWVRRALVLLSSTGARLGEIDGLTRAAVDFERGVVTLVGKTGVRVVPLSADALRELAPAQTQDGDALVLDRNRSYIRSALQSEIAHACRAAEVPAFSPHALRRAACDALYDGRVDPGVAGVLLGHSPLVALRHYRTPRPETLRRAMEGAGLGRIPEGKVLEFASQTGVTPKDK